MYIRTDRLPRAENSGISQGATKPSSIRKKEMSQVEVTHNPTPTHADTMNADVNSSPTVQTEEETMSDNKETTQPTRTTETTMPVTQATTTVAIPKRIRKKRMGKKEKAEKISLLRELAKAGRTREEICDIMGIAREVFERLRTELNDTDKTYYDIPHTEADRGGKVGKGGILISKENIEKMGADKVFAGGTAITKRFDGERIIIERADAKNSLASPNPSTIKAFVDGKIEEISAQGKSEEVEVA